MKSDFRGWNFFCGGDYVKKVKEFRFSNNLVNFAIPEKSRLPKVSDAFCFVIPRISIVMAAHSASSSPSPCSHPVIIIPYRSISILDGDLNSEQGWDSCNLLTRVRPRFLVGTRSCSDTKSYSNKSRSGV